MVSTRQYEKIRNYKDEEFRRLSGVKRSTFKKMIEILEEGEKKKILGYLRNREQR